MMGIWAISWHLKEKQNLTSASHCEALQQLRRGKINFFCSNTICNLDSFSLLLRLAHIFTKETSPVHTI